MLRTIRFYRLEGEWPDTEEALSAELGKAAFQPCGPLTERSSGWTPIDRNAGESLARRLFGADLLKLRSQSRVLPPAVVNEALEERLDEYRGRMQQEPGRREKKRLKAETRDELLPKALLRSDRIWGYYDHTHRLIGVDSAQAAAAERFLRYLRIPFEGYETRPLKFNEPIDALLRNFFLEKIPAPFSLGRECRMQDASDSVSTVRWNDFDLSDSTIRRHVADGMRLTHLALVYDNILSFVLDENGVLGKLRLLGADDDAGPDNNDPLARLDAEFVLMAGTVRRLVEDLAKLLGGFA